MLLAENKKITKTFTRNQDAHQLMLLRYFM